ncbi:MAG: chromate resistance protein ChrB domain-containing protein [Gemmatimonadaceae bacterium]
MVKGVSSDGKTRWLLFLPQVPAKPDYARVKLWRRLQPLGVLPLRAGAYVLPHTPDALEDLQWVGKEVEAAGGTAVVCEAEFLDGISDGELEGQFRERTSYAYREIASGARAALGNPATAAAVARRLRRRFDSERKRDHFGAAGRGDAEQALGDLELSLRATPRAAVSASPGPGTKLPNGVVWVTRADVFVDRIASAWLIRRFIDRNAQFKFVTTPRYNPKPNELRFDMFHAEYTHRGDRCTFEVLLEEFNLTTPALRQIAEIVHDIDLKDDKYQRDESDGITRLLQGLVITEPDDDRRLRAGAQVFDSLFAQFSAEQA